MKDNVLGCAVVPKEARGAVCCLRSADGLSYHSCCCFKYQSKAAVSTWKLLKVLTTALRPGKEQNFVVHVNSGAGTQCCCI